MAHEIHVLVIDNASADHTPEVARCHATARVISNPTNEGFAAAVNQAVREVPQDGTVLLLNPDTELLDGLAPLSEACHRSGLAAGQLVDEESKPQTGFNVRRFPTPPALIFELFGINKMWPSNPVNRNYRYLDRDLSTAGLVEQPAGAFLMFRRDVFDKLGGFDERFHPVWFEDVDFCRRAALAGFGIEYIPSVRARHLGGHSVKKITSESRAIYWCDSLLKYSHKHFRGLAFRAIAGAVILSSIPRLLLEAVKEKRLKPFNVLKIIAFASNCFLMPDRARRPF